MGVQNVPPEIQIDAARNADFSSTAVAGGLAI